MRNVLKVLLWNLVVFGFVSGACGLTIPASEDTVLYQSKFTAGANAASLLTVDANRTAFLYFNLDEVPHDSVLRWAKLRLFLPSVRVRGAGLGVHVVADEWDESAASTKPVQPVATGTIASIGPEKLGTRRFVTVDVTSTVQAWINGGIKNEGFAIAPIIKAGTLAASLYLTSKDGAGFGLPAELDLDFTPTVEAAQLPNLIQKYFSPTFTTQPAISFSEGSIRAEANGLGTITYQWFRNGVAVMGATGSTLSTIGLTSGAYTLRASNGFATVTSSAVQFVSNPVVTPSASFALVPIVGGTYTIGNLIGDSDITDAAPVSVTLSSYYMAVHQTTKAQWDIVRAWATGNGYTDLAAGAGKASNHPVQYVTWYDVVKWANAASEKEGLAPCYKLNGAVFRTGTSDAVTCDWSANRYRFPTEAEWEVAARGGLSGKRFPWGDTISQTQANYRASTGQVYDLSGSVNDFHPTYKTGEWPYTSPVGSFAANGYGLYDMAGNVFQWCWDWFGTPYAGGADPRGAGTGSSRVLRGGGWNYYATRARSANRLNYAASDANYYLGFRLARGRL